MSDSLQRARLSSVELAYVDRGCGMPVVLLHGFPLDHSMWRAQIDALAHGYRAIAPDLRGFGQSSLGAIDVDQGISMERFADDIAELLDALAIDAPIVLAGFSMGGYVAWQFVRKYADRLRALILCDTRSAGDSDDARAARLSMAEHIDDWGGGRVAEMMSPRLFAAKSLQSRPDLVAELRRVVEQTSTAAIAAAQRGMAARPDMTELLTDIRVPTLLLAGSDDAISPVAEMRSMSAAINGALFVEIPHAGHMTTMENPAAVNAAFMEFLVAIEGPRAPAPNQVLN